MRFILLTLAAFFVAVTFAAPHSLHNETSTLFKRYPPPKFTWEGRTPMRGVNLGGWLLIEKFMTPSLFKDTKAHDQWTYDTAAATDPALRTRLTHHWKTFITPADIDAIAAAGLNAVRIPLGYWSVIGAVFNEPYLPGALDVLPPVLERCAQRGIAVIIDLHGLPGSQNGQDNSGHKLATQGGWWGSTGNRGKAWDAAVKLVDLFGTEKYGGTVVAIELMNEPKPKSHADFEFMKGYFRGCYTAIRARDPRMNVMFSDGWARLGPGGPWDGFGKGMRRVSMDTHLYTFSGGKLGYRERLAKFCSRKDEFVASNRQIPTIVGEWTLAASNDCGNMQCPPSGRDEFLRRSFETQTWIYEQAKGWVYWNWRMENDENEWSFRGHLERGTIPTPVTKRKFGTPCQ